MKLLAINWTSSVEGFTDVSMSSCWQQKCSTDLTVRNFDELIPTTNEGIEALFVQKPMPQVNEIEINFARKTPRDLTPWTIGRVEALKNKKHHYHMPRKRVHCPGWGWGWSKFEGIDIHLQYISIYLWEDFSIKQISTKPENTSSQLIFSGRVLPRLPCQQNLLGKGTEVLLAGLRGVLI